jgi:hypothetical protein
VADILDGLHPQRMRPRVEAMLADPDAIEKGMFVRSGFRSRDEQQRLYDNKTAEVRAAHPSWTESQVRFEVGKWVAPPGTSNHEARLDGFGIAVDLGFPGVVASNGQWTDTFAAEVDAIAARYGLASILDWEDWHFEPVGEFDPPARKTARDEEDMATTCIPTWATRDPQTTRAQAYRLTVDAKGVPIVLAMNGAPLNVDTPTRRAAFSEVFGIPFVTLPGLAAKPLGVHEIESTGAIVVLCEDGGMIDVARRPVQGDPLPFPSTPSRGRTR